MDTKPLITTLRHWITGESLGTSLNLGPAVIAILLCAGAVLPAQEVRSPDANLAVNLTLTDGTPAYGVTYKGKVFLDPSPLGLETSLGSFATGLPFTAKPESTRERRC